VSAIIDARGRRAEQTKLTDDCGAVGALEFAKAVGSELQARDSVGGQTGIGSTQRGYLAS
jgi:hypothetical protein